MVNLTPPGAEPHDLELSPRDVGRVRDAALAVYAGDGFQPAVEEAVRGPQRAVRSTCSTARRAAVGDATRTSGSIPSASQPSRGRSRRRWGRRPRPTTSSRGSTRSTASTVGVSHGARAARSSRATRRSGISLPGTASCRSRWSGLQPEAEPGPREVERLVDEVRATGATTVFSEPLASPALADAVAREAGVATAVLDPLEGLTADEADTGADYFSVMEKNLDVLRTALGCR